MGTDCRMTKKILIALGVVIVIVAAIALALRMQKPAVVHPAAPAAVTPGAAPSAKPPADCLLPGPPPVPPNGETATAAEMKLGHDVMQAFVQQLEDYQACRNNQIDHPPPGASTPQKEIWLQQGNDAVDEANMLANAFSAQLKAFKARNPGQ